jgi:hypothetical protein
LGVVWMDAGADGVLFWAAILLLKRDQKGYTDMLIIKYSKSSL